MVDVRVLSSEDLRDLAPPETYVEAVRAAYRDRGRGAPTRPRVTLRDGGETPGILTGYHAILPGVGAMGGYLYSAGFAARDAWFVLPVFDARTGELRAILDGSSINPLKTGAVAAVAADALAREDAQVVGILGSGAQARGQLRCLATVRDLEAARVFSPTRAHRERYAREMTEAIGVEVEAVASSEAAVHGADVVVTATTSPTPVVADAHLDEGVHLTCMGQYHPERREVEGATVARSLYVPDLRDRVQQDAGAFLVARDEGLVTDDHVHGELGEVLVGKVPGRTRAEEITLFDSGGTALETVAAAHMLVERAEERGLGTKLPFRSASEGMEGR